MLRNRFSTIIDMESKERYFVGKEEAVDLPEIRVFKVFKADFIIKQRF